MGKINKAVLRKQLMDTAMRNVKLKAVAFKEANENFQKSKGEMIKEFDYHPITREIEGGPSATNSSGTLGGVGNLYSFIGFDRGTDPIKPVRNMLMESTRLLKVPKIRRGKHSIHFEYGVRYPSKDMLAKVAPMPWEPGSWLLKIETGISGLGYYIYEKFLNKSRSGTGVQSSQKVRQIGAYRRRSYLTSILFNFTRSLNFK